MTKYRYTSLFSTLFILLCANLSMAEDIHKKSGTTSAAFLKVDAASRPISMGGAFTGLADDVNALFWNPAGLMSLQKQQISAMQNFSIGNVWPYRDYLIRAFNQDIPYDQFVREHIAGDLLKDCLLYTSDAADE